MSAASDSRPPGSGTRASASPNIAFVKYWGKLPSSADSDRNLPCNASLSMTLSKARTNTTVELLPVQRTSEIVLNGREASPQDVEKVTTHLRRICEFSGAPLDSRFRVESANNFPQGTGLASSASAFAALTVAGLGELLGRSKLESVLRESRDAVSALARRGSGSACRSLEGPYVKWEGATAHKLPYTFQLFDTILIFSRDHKKVPSSEGHRSAQSSPLFARRLNEVPARLRAIESALEHSSLADLGPLLEAEALELHEIARSGTPPITYLNPESARFVKWLAAQRERDFFFTLDAGPNVHLISERPLGKDFFHWLERESFSCEIWEDEQGLGPSY